MSLYGACYLCSLCYEALEDRPSAGFSPSPMQPLQNHLPVLFQSYFSAISEQCHSPPPFSWRSPSPLSLILDADESLSNLDCTRFKTNLCAQWSFCGALVAWLHHEGPKSNLSLVFCLTKAPKRTLLWDVTLLRLWKEHFYLVPTLPWFKIQPRRSKVKLSITP